MSYKDILVHVDDSARCPDRIELAARIAESHGAHLTGMAIRSVPHVPHFVMAQLGAEVVEAQKKYSEQAATLLKSTFEDITKRVGGSNEFRLMDGELIDSFSLNARYTDCIVVGQHDPKEELGDGEGGLVDHLVMDAGRPVLVIPYAGKFDTIGKRVVVAWNSSRESTRAVNDALPFLVAADKVEILVINPSGGREGHGDLPGADICLHLARHGVNAEAHAIYAESMDPGSILLSRVADEGADMIVMGAYGRSRLREMVLGGATRHVIKHMTVPVLMSH